MSDPIAGVQLGVFLSVVYFTKQEQIMKVAVLGAKVVGSTLGRKWASAGHEVMFGVRDVQNPQVKTLAKELGAQIGSLAEAIEFAQVVVFAIPGRAMEETIKTHAQRLNGKTVIDAVNHMDGGPLNSAALFAEHAPQALVFRAFNSLGWESFENPRYGDQQADLFYCGTGGEAQTVVEELIREVGLRPIRVGTIDQAHLVDGITSLWLALAFGQKMGRQFAFKLLRR
jgi:8-hydroxy-5-deazaflavin:NADPH oxidoreductase